MSDELLQVARMGSVLTLTMNRASSANALSTDLVEALIHELESLNPADIRLCVIKGNGKHFCAGFDLSELDQLDDAQLLWRLLRIEHLLQLIYHAPVATQALAQGSAYGAGADLFCACANRIASPCAKFCMPGWNFELALGTRRLVARIGNQHATSMLIDSRVVRSDEALSIGLASVLVDIDQWEQCVMGYAARANVLSEFSLKGLFEIVNADTRESDIAAIVRTAGRPGLKDRVMAYRNVVAEKRSKNKLGSGAS